MGEPAQSHYLGNQFLIAMPQLAGSYFADTVTYLCKHDEQGALGIVINKPLGARVIDIFNELDISCDLQDSRFTTQRILSGGPVERDKGFIVHDATAHWDSSISVTPEISVCTSRKILKDIAGGRGPENYLIALGCAGWEPGQLEREISENAWLTAPAQHDLIFSDNYGSKSKEAAALLGVDLQCLSPATGHS